MKHTGLPLSSFPPHVQDQIAAQLHAKPSPACPGVKVGHKVAPGLRQASKGPNKTEAAFAAHIRALYPTSVIFGHAVTLVLANGLRYTPDFFFPSHGVRSAFYEVKGFMRDDAAAKIKMAARLYQSWADFWLVTKKTRKQGGGWRIEIVLP
jgi:hypothetical protein